MSIARKITSGASGSGGSGGYVDDVFSTYLYKGNGFSGNPNPNLQVVANGINLDDKGGLVWIKNRNAYTDHQLQTTDAGYALSSNSSAAAVGNQIFEATPDGFNLLTRNPLWNALDEDYASWTFAKQEGFFDIVTYSGDGVAGRQIPHNLGSTPGMIIVKSTTRVDSWAVYHRSMGNQFELRLDKDFAKDDDIKYWNYTDPTDTVFTVGTDSQVNGAGEEYVAYLFAHDAQEFGPDGDESIIKCGSLSVSNYNVEEDLGWEPQWLLFKESTGVNNWTLIDNMRGSADPQALLYPNEPDAEIQSGTVVEFTSRGFVQKTLAGSDEGIYMAIRRPHKPNVSLLLDGDGTNGANNNTFTDSSSNNFGITETGRVLQGSFSPYAASQPLDITTDGGSGYFDASSYLTVASDPAFDIVNSNMTVEAWLYVTKMPTGNLGQTGQSFVVSRWTASGDQRSWMIVYGKDGEIRFWTSRTGTASYNQATSANGVIKLNTWHHVAGTYDGSTIKLYVDGVLVGSAAATSVRANPSSPIQVNAINDTLTGTSTSYVTDVRYQNDAVIYTSNFTPPQSPLGRLNGSTALLLNFQDAGIYDLTGKSNLETLGTAAVSTAQKKYGTGSIDVTGSGYLTTSTADSFDVGGVFTVEFWVNYYGVAGNQTLIDSDPGSYFYIAYTAGRIYVANLGNNVLSPLHTPVINQWYHYAVVCDGSTYKIYVDGQLLEDSSAVSSRVIDSWAVGARYNGVFQGNCYIDDLRITKDVARYTGNFTPPTQALPKY